MLVAAFSVVVASFTALELAICCGCVGGNPAVGESKSSSNTTEHLKDEGDAWIDGLVDWLWNVLGRGRVPQLIGGSDLQRLHVVLRDTYVGCPTFFLLLMCVGFSLKR